MQKQYDEIKNAAMTLSPDERVLLADQLYMSVSEREQAEIDAEWADEAERRLREINEGKAKTIPGDQVLAEARALLKK
jgi:putative addiction module component (TIGR02574 family)